MYLVSIANFVYGLKSLKEAVPTNNILDDIDNDV